MPHPLLPHDDSSYYEMNRLFAQQAEVVVQSLALNKRMVQHFSSMHHKQPSDDDSTSSIVNMQSSPTCCVTHTPQRSDRHSPARGDAAIASEEVVLDVLLNSHHSAPHSDYLNSTSGQGLQQQSDVRRSVENTDKLESTIARFEQVQLQELRAQSERDVAINKALEQLSTCLSELTGRMERGFTSLSVRDESGTSKLQQPIEAASAVRGFGGTLKPHPGEEVTPQVGAVDKSASNDGTASQKMQAASSWNKVRASLKHPLLKSIKGAGDSDGTRGRQGANIKDGSQTRMASLFPKVDEIKGRVLASLEKQRYDVEDYYAETGPWQQLARNDYFKYLGLVVIMTNTLWIAIETDYNKQDILCNASAIFQISDNLYCCWFCFELLVRFMAFENKSDAFGDNWFMFDGSLVLLMVWETWIEVFCYLVLGFPGDTQGGSSSPMRASGALRILRLVRLIRVARATRVVANLPELLILVKGIGAGTRSVVAVLFLSLLVIYVFAVIFTELLADQVPEFDTVPQSMNYLLQVVLCGPDAALMKTLLDASWTYYVIFISFILVAVLTVMNMLIGILCDVVATVAETEKEESFQKEVERQIHRLAEELDTDGSGTITQAEFDIILHDPALTTSFYDIGVDLVGLADFARFIFDQCDEITYSEYAQLVCEFHGSKITTVKDLMALRRYLSMELLSLEDRLMGGPRASQRMSVASACSQLQQG